MQHLEAAAVLDELAFAHGSMLSANGGLRNGRG